jgi:hypothetical protein
MQHYVVVELTDTSCLLTTVISTSLTDYVTVTAQQQFMYITDVS